LAAGVLMGVSVFHMLPDALASCSNVQALGVYVLGFIFVTLLDTVLSHDDQNADEDRTPPLPPSSQQEQRCKDEEIANVNENSPLLLEKALERETSFATDGSSTVSCLSCQQGDHEEVSLSGQVMEGSLYVAFSDKNHCEPQTLQSSKNSTMASAWSLWLALSVHSLLEGASLGAQPDRLDLALGLFLHKGLVAFSVTTSWHQICLNHQQYRYVWVVLCLSFAAMTPFGIILGWTLMKDHLEGRADGIVAALAGGTFLYVGVGELLLPSWKKTSDRVLAVLAVAAGLGLAALLAG